jgi:hypothetical protein
MRHSLSLFGGLFAVVVFLAGCAGPAMITKSAKFPGMYDEKPLAILVLPPINSTTAADAKEYYATTISAPLALSGYYVLPIEVTSDIMKSQGLYDTEMIADQPLDRFGQYFGADAVLFTHIKKWDKSFMVLASTLTVSVDAQLKSTKTNRVLWAYSGTIVANLSGQNSSAGNPLVGLIAQALVTSVNTAAADYVPYARLANVQLLQSMPAGKYHARFGQDGDDRFRDLSPGKN